MSCNLPVLQGEVSEASGPREEGVFHLSTTQKPLAHASPSSSLLTQLHHLCKLLLFV